MQLKKKKRRQGKKKKEGKYISLRVLFTCRIPSRVAQAMRWECRCSLCNSCSWLLVGVAVVWFGCFHKAIYPSFTLRGERLMAVFSRDSHIPTCLPKASLFSGCCNPRGRRAKRKPVFAALCCCPRPLSASREDAQEHSRAWPEWESRGRGGDGVGRKVWRWCMFRLPPSPPAVPSHATPSDCAWGSFERFWRLQLWEDLGFLQLLICEVSSEGSKVRGQQMMPQFLI